jgi:hypothetical protein
MEHCFNNLMGCRDLRLVKMELRTLTVMQSMGTIQFYEMKF